MMNIVTKLEALFLIIIILEQVIKYFKYTSVEENPGECIVVSKKKFSFIQLKPIFLLVIILFLMSIDDITSLVVILFVILLIVESMESIRCTLVKVKIYEKGVLTTDGYLTWDKINSYEWLKSYDGNSKINFDYKLSKFSVKDVTVIFSNTERIIVENLLEKNCEI